MLTDFLAAPFFLISVGLNTWASMVYLHRLGWEFVGGEQVPWPSSLARGPYGWAQAATLLSRACADRDPDRRGTGSAAAQNLPHA